MLSFALAGLALILCDCDASAQSKSIADSPVDAVVRTVSGESPADRTLPSVGAAITAARPIEAAGVGDTQPSTGSGEAAAAPRPPAGPLALDSPEPPPHGLFLVIARFADRAGAEAYAIEIDRWRPVLQQSTVDGRPIHRVLIGPIDWSDLDMALDILRAGGVTDAWPIVALLESPTPTKIAAIRSN